MTTQLCICADAGELADRSARHIAAAASTAVGQRGSFSLCLSGGDTPGATYARLGGPLRDQLPWTDTHIFWGDERCIPLERPDNHFTMATELMLSQVPIPAANIHRIHAESGDPARAAADYTDELRRFVTPPGARWPIFDLVLLGMGEDGHVASLFPGSDGLRERSRWVVDHYVVKRGERVRRVTLTMPVLTAAREVMVLVSGEIKAGMLAAVLEGAADVPAREPNTDAASVVWMADGTAAAHLAGAAAPVAEVAP